MGSVEVIGRKFTCDAPVCGKEEIVFGKNPMEESTWIEGGVDADHYANEIEFTACCAGHIIGAILAATAKYTLMNPRKRVPAGLLTGVPDGD